MRSQKPALGVGDNRLEIREILEAGERRQGLEQLVDILCGLEIGHQLSEFQDLIEEMEFPPTATSEWAFSIS